MPRPKKNQPYTPSYRLHSPTGKAVVTINGQDHYLGEHGTPESYAWYNSLISQYFANGGRLPDQTPARAYSVDDLIADYMDHIVPRYTSSTGEQSTEIEAMKVAFASLHRAFGSLPACEFGPRALESLQMQLAQTKAKHGRVLCRSTVNRRINFIRRLFRWGAQRNVVPLEVHGALTVVEHLRANRSPAREPSRPTPVPQPHIDAVLQFLSPTLKVMAQVHVLTGMRSGELLQMRPCDITMESGTASIPPYRNNARTYRYCSIQMDTI